MFVHYVLMSPFGKLIEILCNQKLKRKLTIQFDTLAFLALNFKFQLLILSIVGLLLDRLMMLLPI